MSFNWGSKNDKFLKMFWACSQGKGVIEQIIFGEIFFDPVTSSVFVFAKVLKIPSRSQLSTWCFIMSIPFTKFASRVILFESWWKYPHYIPLLMYRHFALNTVGLFSSNRRCSKLFVQSWSNPKGRAVFSHH